MQNRAQVISYDTAIEEDGVCSYLCYVNEDLKNDDQTCDLSNLFNLFSLAKLIENHNSFKKKN